MNGLAKMETTIQAYLERHKMTRKQLLARLTKEGWTPSRGTVSRWINGKREPSPAAKAVLKKISKGEIKYDA